MNGMTLSEAARLIEARHIGADAVFTAVSSDTRNLENGDLFVALRGHSFDGHEFIGQARERGACAAVVSRDLPASLPLLLVADTRLALGRLAAGWRARTDIPVVAVTGSNGKTTVKEMTAAILARRGQVLATRGNLNNDIGVPLTLLRLRPEHRHAVIEMGANHPGEIAYLTRLAQPTVALITNAGPAHLEGFGDVAGVARAKGEIYGGLRREGVAVINADDAHAGLWRELTRKHRVLTFGLNTAADVTVLQAQDQADTRVRLQTPAGQVDVALPLPGRHNVMNALAATAAALACGAALQDVKQGLESMQPVSGRLQSHAGPHGARIIDDTYNANPASLVAALEVLAASGGERWLVLGDMGELGAAGPELHWVAGRQARSAGVQRLYATGELSRLAVQAFGAGARHFDDPQALIAALQADLHAGLTVLIKGSRAMRMERVAQALGAAALSHGGRH